MGKRTYNSFSGVDIKAVLGTHILGSLQAISYSIVREKVPVYVMGRVSPLAFSRGKRAVAGSLIFIMFDAHPILRALGNTDDKDGAVRSEFKFYKDKDEAQPDLKTARPVNVTNSIDSAAQSSWEVTDAFYVDQIPPFDITLSAANEMGTRADMRIIGVELLNEGWGISIDDIVSETQYTYIARDVFPWTRKKKYEDEIVGITSTDKQPGARTD